MFFCYYFVYAKLSYIKSSRDFGLCRIFGISADGHMKVSCLLHLFVSCRMLLNVCLIFKALMTFVGDSSYVTPKIYELKMFFIVQLFIVILLLSVLCTLQFFLFSSVIK
jgi:hypothetical protein